MNKDRRKEIARIQEEISDALSKLNSALEDLDTVKGEEEEAFEGLPEGLQASEQGERMGASAEALGEAHGAVESAISALDEVEGYLDTAVE